MKLSFTHDIFKTDGLSFTGEVTFKRTLITMYKLDGAPMTEGELKTILLQEDEKHGWKQSEDEYDFRHRLGVYLMNPDVFQLEKIESEKAVEVTLHPGSNFEYGFRSPADEGYSTYGIKTEWDEDGWTVEETTGGRDCDGEHSNQSDWKEYPDGRKEDLKNTNYDQYAEMAGY